MNVKLLLVTVAVVVVIADIVGADFGFQHYPPKEEDLKSLGLECFPRRTVIKLEEAKEGLKNEDSGEDTVDDGETRRSHMNAGQNSSEKCKVCVCSVDGKMEYCSRRPARNINECIRMAMLTEKLQKNIPYRHEDTLAFRIRRDYLWHYDEIPYEPNAKCPRGSSYYTRDKNPNDTTINRSQEVKEFTAFDVYSTKDVCYFCICSTSGRDVMCINRTAWYCDLYKEFSIEGARARYKTLFGQDRPGYFRQLSYRLRRNMDEGFSTLLDIGGDTLCCGHPDGHRRNLHNHIRNKIRQLRRKMPRENILGNSPRGDYVDFIVNND